MFLKCLSSFELIIFLDKTIKLWKVSERDRRAEGYNLKEENGTIRDPSSIKSLRYYFFFFQYLCSKQDLIERGVANNKWASGFFFLIANLFKRSLNHFKKVSIGSKAVLRIHIRWIRNILASWILIRRNMQIRADPGGKIST